MELVGPVIARNLPFYVDMSDILDHMMLSSLYQNVDSRAFSSSKFWQFEKNHPIIEGFFRAVNDRGPTSCAVFALQ